MNLVNEWGPAILVCFTIIVGIIFNNRRIDDLKASLEKQISELDKRLSVRIDGLEKQIADLDKRLTTRIDELDKRLSEKIDNVEKRLSDRIERLEHPVYRA